MLSTLDLTATQRDDLIAHLVPVSQTLDSPDETDTETKLTSLQRAMEPITHALANQSASFLEADRPFLMALLALLKEFLPLLIPLLIKSNTADTTK
jgi:hypothetical protein